MRHLSVRVLLVDDHNLMRLALHTTISRDPTIQIVGEAADGVNAVELAHRLRPDVVLMDLQLPVLSGVEATRQIAQELPDVKVIMLTMYKEGELPLEALRVGAVGYLHKDDEPAQILQAIHTVAEGQAFLTPQLARQVLAQFHRGDENPPQVPTGAKPYLTPREIELLRLVKEGLSNKEIARQLGLSDSRVRNQLSEVYQKIEVSGRTQAAMYAVEQELL